MKLPKGKRPETIKISCTHMSAKDSLDSLIEFQFHKTPIFFSVVTSVRPNFVFFIAPQNKIKIILSVHLRSKQHYNAFPFGMYGVPLHGKTFFP